MTKIKCKKCGDIIYGDGKGTYISCSCGSLAVDQTEYYTRIIGNLCDYEKIKETKNDIVNHPSHYTDGKIEVWDYIRDKNLNYFLGNAIKYISRAGKKDKSKYVEDLQKAIAYLQKEIDNKNSNGDK